MHTLEGHESLPYFVVQRGDKDTKRFDVYDAASGVRVLTDSLTKQEAIDSAIALLIDDNRRQDWIIKRETAREIEQEQIDEYNNDNDIETEGFEYFVVKILPAYPVRLSLVGRLFCPPFNYYTLT